VYGHLGETRHRAEAAEYRVEQHAAKLKDRLAALRAGGASALFRYLFRRLPCNQWA